MSKKHTYTAGLCPVRLFVITYVGLCGSARAVSEGALSVRLVDAAPTNHLVAQQTQRDTGNGNTSIANDTNFSIKSGGKGYYTQPYPGGTEVPYMQRNRDLGQVFTVTGTEPVRLRAITISTGPGDNVVRTNMYGQAVALQVFEVVGEPILNHNGSTSGNTANHGWPHLYGQINHIRDDYYTGMTFTPLAVATGGFFPSVEDFGFASGTVPAPSDPALKLKHLRWELSGDACVVLQPGQRYAFMMMVVHEGAARGFTVANVGDNRGTNDYTGGFGIRREGNGVRPPPRAYPEFAVDHPTNATALAGARLPADFATRLATPFGTEGYPDVCTYRDWEFYVEATPASAKEPMCLPRP